MKYLQDYMEDKQTALFEKTGSFFAFSPKQFSESKKENIKYTNMGAGLICPTDNIEELINGLDDIYNKAVKQDVEDNSPEKIIEREYFNHETQISGDRRAALDAIDGHRKAFPELFNDKFITQVMNKCWNKAVENNWF